MKIELPLTLPPTSVPATSVARPEAAVRAESATPVGQASQAGPAPVARQPSQKELQQAVSELQRKAQSFSPNLRFSVDRDTGRTVVRVTDANTQELIRQIPAEEVLQLAKELDRMQGLLFNNEA